VCYLKFLFVEYVFDDGVCLMCGVLVVVDELCCGVGWVFDDVCYVVEVM